jgi:hypothetical protein
MGMRALGGGGGDGDKKLTRDVKDEAASDVMVRFHDSLNLYK